MPKGVDNLFTHSGTSAATLLSPSSRKTVDASSGDAPRGQSFRKALDQAKPKQSEPEQPRPTSTRTKIQNKKPSNASKSDAPVDPNALAQPVENNDQPESSTVDVADEALTEATDAQPVDEQPEKPDVTDEPVLVDDQAIQTDAAILASAVANDAQAAAQVQTDEHIEHPENATEQSIAALKIQEPAGPARKAAPRASSNSNVKTVSASTLKKSMQKTDEPKTSDNDVHEEIPQELPEQADAAQDEHINDELPEKAPITKTAGAAPHESEPQPPEVKGGDRANKPVLRQFEKTNSDSSNEQAAPVVDVSQIDVDAPSQTSKDDHQSQADRLAPLQALSMLDATASAPKAPAAGPVQSNQPPAPPPAPEQDFAANNHDRLVTSMRSQLLPNGGTMHLRLDPPELGVLQVNVRMVDGAMTASFETSNDQATKLLSHSLSQLKQVLETQGVNVEKLHVQQTPSNQQGNSSNEDRQQQSDGQNQSARQEQQRREMLQRMWKKLRLGSDPLDMVA